MPFILSRAEEEIDGGDGECKMQNAEYKFRMQKINQLTEEVEIKNKYE